MPKITGEVADDPRIATISADVKLALTRINALQATANTIQTTAHAMTVATAEAGKVSALAAAVAGVDAKVAMQDATLQAILAAVKSLGTVVPPPVPQPDPQPVGWPPAAQPGPGSIVNLPAGTFAAGYHFDNDDVTVKGAGMRLTKLDGKRGAFRPPWGKGGIHIAGAKNLKIEDVGFWNWYPGSGRSDGTSGFYNEAGTAHLLRCAFDGNGNGGYAMPREYMSDKALPNHTLYEKCVFGREAGNGVGDERSHDVYIGGHSVAFLGSIFCGTTNGNSLKLRVSKADVAGCHIRRTAGRFFDVPGGCILNSKGNTYVTNPGATSNNSMGFFDEDNIGNNSDGYGEIAFVDDTFVFGGRHTEIWWLNHPEVKMSFTNCRVLWYGDRPPFVVASRDVGASVQLPLPDFFTFGEHNRIAGPPAVPADPV